MVITPGEWLSVQPAAFGENCGGVFLELATLAPGQATEHLAGDIGRRAKTGADRAFRLLDEPGRQIRVEPRTAVFKPREAQRDRPQRHEIPLCGHLAHCRPPR